MTRHRNFLLSIAAALLSTVLASGCATETRDDAKKAAVERWMQTRANLMYGVARQAFEVGELDKSERTCRGVLAEEPLNLPFLKLWARIQIERGQLEPAMATLNHAAAVNEEDSETHYLLGLVNQRWQRYDEALLSYRKSYVFEPENVRGLLAVTEMLVKLDRVDEAIEGLEAKLVYFEYNAAVRVALGRIHALRGENTQAIHYYREASLLSPDDLQITEHLSRALLSDGQHANAIDYLTQLLADESYAQRRDIRADLAEAYMATNNVAKARLIYLDLTREAPQIVDNWIKLGQAAWILGDDRRVAEAAERTIALDPDRYEGYLLRGMSTQKAGDVGEALAFFKRASELEPNNPLPLVLQGMGFEQAGQPAAAAEAYNQALRVAPDDVRARHLLARLESDGDR
ncbi:MAG: hypothetical protein CMJ49_04460 [Planctomycetaceae bacterium]|nr:hypothetical protein [Planctomycetaceae bacterium]